MLPAFTFLCKLLLTLPSSFKMCPAMAEAFTQTYTSQLAASDHAACREKTCRLRKAAQLGLRP